MSDTNNTTNASASAEEIIDSAAAAAAARTQAAVDAVLSSRWSWKRITMYAGVAVVATAATYLGVKVMRKPKAVQAVADAAAAVVDAAIPAA
jgi:hypothetical protein